MEKISRYPRLRLMAFKFPSIADQGSLMDPNKSHFPWDDSAEFISISVLLPKSQFRFPFIRFRFFQIKLISFNARISKLPIQMGLCKIQRRDYRRASVIGTFRLFVLSSTTSSQNAELFRCVIFLKMIDCLSSLIDFGIVEICLALICFVFLA